jgi:transcriptional regulator with XRE-family HTH domain
MLGQMGLMHSCITHHDASTHYGMQAASDNAAMHQRTRQIIQKLMEQEKVPSERHLALACSMSQSTLHRFLKGETETLDFKHLQALAHYFSLTVSQLTGETPFNEDPKVRLVTLAMERMPEYLKDMMVTASSSLSKAEKPDGDGAGNG